jgi:hypothetical protein
MTVDRDRLRALAEAATPGSWEAVSHPGEGRILAYASVVTERTSDQVAIVEDARADVGYEEPHAVTPYDDAAFIAAADPTTIIQLLNELDDLHRELER